MWFQRNDKLQNINDSSGASSYASKLYFRRKDSGITNRSALNDLVDREPRLLMSILRRHPKTPHLSTVSTPTAPTALAQSVQSCRKSH